MKRHLFILFVFVNQVLFSQQADNAELQNMYEQDQKERQKIVDWLTLNKNDSVRRSRVYQLIAEEKVVTGKDNYHAAMIFQHGKDSVAYRMAIKLMRKALELDTTVNRWLLAAAIDRELMSRRKPQIYGTQYIKRNEPNAKWEKYMMDTTQLTDQERIYYHVESLAQQREKLRKMNLENGDEVEDKCNFKTIEDLKANQSSLPSGLILEFLMAMDSLCRNNAEWSEASNETLFWLADIHTKNFIDCLKVNQSKINIGLILEEFKQPIHDNIDLKGIYSKLQGLNDNDKIVKDILTSLKLAQNSLKAK